MIKALLCATLAVSAVPAVSAASAKPGSCARTDPRGDVELTGGVPVDRPHLDLLGYGVTVGSTEVVAVIRTAAAGNGRWSLSVARDDRGTGGYYFSALRGTPPIDDPRTAQDETRAPQFIASGPGGNSVPARGTISASGEIRIRVRLKDYRAHAPRRGTPLTHFTVWAYERLPSAGGLTVQARDDAHSAC